MVCGFAGLFVVWWCCVEWAMSPILRISPVYKGCNWKCVQTYWPARGYVMPLVGPCGGLAKRLHR